MTAPPMRENREPGAIAPFTIAGARHDSAEARIVSGAPTASAIGRPTMTVELPEVPPQTVAQWRRVVDLVAGLARVPAVLVMRTGLPQNTVLVSSGMDGNACEVGGGESNESLFHHGACENDGERVVDDVTRDLVGTVGEDPDHGVSCWIGYPLKWPGGELFGTIHVLNRKRHKNARLVLEGLQTVADIIESSLHSLGAVAERQRMEKRVEACTRELAKADNALRVLLSTAESARVEHGENILQHINTLVIPYVEKLSQFLHADHPGRVHLDLVETNLKSLTSSLSSRMTLEFQKLTAVEVEVAQLVLHGRSSKEIAKTLQRSTSTVSYHRKNIRAKLGLGRNEHLRAYLHSIR